MRAVLLQNVKFHTLHWHQGWVTYVPMNSSESELVLLGDKVSHKFIFPLHAHFAVQIYALLLQSNKLEFGKSFESPDVVKFLQLSRFHNVTNGRRRLQNKTELQPVGTTGLSCNQFVPQDLESAAQVKDEKEN